ncbi:LysR substrate-binding domain-containing protein [Nitratireductor pacificus]|uniref:LysR family transcriptional regulator n=1 Tax=Nitratireductor pacificus pht-3B TaxID=391937 RepID=K2LSA4_9HYPH|nr:LysR substrate-binding domain-containing protein [Nitratireductor pacificus]EKF20619.1 LysR family transcriptional regulator [Nitratireductor pacificus pht-3B]
MSFRLRHLETFHAVMSCGSVSQAAVSLHTSQPTTSRTLSEFEREVGFKLFHREVNRLRPTPEAHELYRAIHQNYLCLDQIADLAHRVRDNRAGSLRISAAPSIAMSVLPVALKLFLERFPGIGATLEVRTPQSIINLIEEGEIDLGVTAANLRSDQLTIRPLMRVQGVCIMRRDHPLAARKSIRPADFDGYPFISLGKPSVTRQRIDLLFEQHAVQPNIVAETQNASVACALVSQDMGISILDELTVGAIPMPDVTHRPIIPRVEIDYVTMTPRNRPFSRATAKFCQVLDEIIASAAHRHLPGSP